MSNTEYYLSPTQLMLNSTTFSYNETCVSRKTTSFLVFTIIPTVPLFVNVVLLVSVALDSGRLLRQSRVYAHVSSTLLANVIFSALGLVQILSLYFNFEGYYDSPIPGYQAAVKEELATWWAFRKAFLYGLYIVMCGNIGLLIEAIRSSTCTALRNAAGAIRFRSPNTGKRWQNMSFVSSRQWSGRTHDTAVPSSRVAKRRRSYISISLLWILSFGYVLATAVGWSCVGHCTCLSSCFPEGQIQDPPVRGCSRAFPPMANSWLAVTIGIWAFCLMGVFILIRRSILLLNKAIRKHHPEESDDVFLENEPAESENKITKSPHSVDQELSEIKSERKEKVDSNDKNRTKIYYARKISGNEVDKSGKKTRVSTTSFFGSISDHRSLLSRRKPFRSNHISNALNKQSSLKYVIWLTALYAFCTTPPMAYLAADMSFPHMTMNMVVMNVCLVFPYIYCFICPIVLGKCLPGVKASLVRLVFKLCSYSKTDRTSISSIG
uniref:uncharacterized protein LOC120336168 n=1 Tax=Styela clava TaxID=7725 RepID=UPI00193A9E8B|nr:uncharacterized protein LOC120336168 [Styela clava]